MSGLRVHNQDNVNNFYNVSAAVIDADSDDSIGTVTDADGATVGTYNYSTEVADVGGVEYSKAEVEGLGWIFDDAPLAVCAGHKILDGEVGEFAEQEGLSVFEVSEPCEEFRPQGVLLREPHTNKVGVAWQRPNGSGLRADPVFANPIAIDPVLSPKLQPHMSFDNPNLELFEPWIGDSGRISMGNLAVDSSLPPAITRLLQWHVPDESTLFADGGDSIAHVDADMGRAVYALRNGAAHFAIYKNVDEVDTVYELWRGVPNDKGVNAGEHTIDGGNNLFLEQEVPFHLRRPVSNESSMTLRGAITDIRLTSAAREAGTAQNSVAQAFVGVVYRLRDDIDIAVEPGTPRTMFVQYHLADSRPSITKLNPFKGRRIFAGSTPEIGGAGLYTFIASPDGGNLLTQPAPGVLVPYELDLQDGLQRALDFGSFPWTDADGVKHHTVVPANVQDTHMWEVESAYLGLETFGDVEARFLVGDVDIVLGDDDL